MPELPEVQTIRQTLAAQLIGCKVVSVQLRRPGIVHGPIKPADLLVGHCITSIDRHGKQLAIRTRTTPGLNNQLKQSCICVHLGMTGSLRFLPGANHGVPISHDLLDNRHTHVVWHLDNTNRLIFHDPRRFGGLWTFTCFDALYHARWKRLGPDALTIKPKQLYLALAKTTRPIKAALLDQRVMAGLGNIYADELLFACRISPYTVSRSISLSTAQLLVRHLRILLTRAIQAGGTTLRDYVDSNGQVGRFQKRHKVYGRCGKPCYRCGCQLDLTRIIGRSTVYCRSCQLMEE